MISIASEADRISHDHATLFGRGRDGRTLDRRPDLPRKSALTVSSALPSRKLEPGHAVAVHRIASRQPALDRRLASRGAFASTRLVLSYRDRQSTGLVVEVAARGAQLPRQLHCPAVHAVATVNQQRHNPVANTIRVANAIRAVAATVGMSAPHCSPAHCSPVPSSGSCPQSARRGDLAARSCHTLARRAAPRAPAPPAARLTAPRAACYRRRRHDEGTRRRPRRRQPRHHQDVREGALDRPGRHGAPGHHVRDRPVHHHLQDAVHPARLVGVGPLPRLVLALARHRADLQAGPGAAEQPAVADVRRRVHRARQARLRREPARRPRGQPRQHRSARCAARRPSRPPSSSRWCRSSPPPARPRRSSACSAPSSASCSRSSRSRTPRPPRRSRSSAPASPKRCSPPRSAWSPRSRR